MYVAKICLNSVPGGLINFILGADITTIPQQVPSNGATKYAFYDRIYQKRKGL